MMLGILVVPEKTRYQPHVAGRATEVKQTNDFCQISKVRNGFGKSDKVW